jgi:GT2 family glycosyltransferase
MKAEKNPIIYAIMLNWNEYHHTVPCIDSLKNSTIPFDKIIILDQASEDGSGEKLYKLYLGDEQILILQNEKNYGFAVGMNIGIQKALSMGAEYVFIINNDTIVDKECIKTLFKVLKQKELAAVAGPAIMYYSKPEKLWQSGGYFNKLKMGITVPNKGKLYSEIDHDISEVSFLTGCALLVPENTFKKVGVFDPDYFFYGDDVDYGLRIINEGMKMYFVPEAKVWHKIEDIAIDRTTPYVLFHLAKSTIIMLRKRFSGLEKIYGIFLEFSVYTLFRIWQIIKGRKGYDSLIAWFNGLIQGMTTKINK